VGIVLGRRPVFGASEWGVVPELEQGGCEVIKCWSGALLCWEGGARGWLEPGG